MNMKKMLALALAVLMIVGASVAGTIAWLTDTTEEVTNTFAVGDIEIELEETVANNSFKIVPNGDDSKDPKVTVLANSENCYVFVQVKEVDNTVAEGLKYVTWEIAEGWTQLGTTQDGVSTYYRSYTDTDTDTDVSYDVLKGNKVTYSEDLTATQLETAEEAQPRLIFKAFAVQAENVDNVNVAWGLVDESLKLS